MDKSVRANPVLQNPCAVGKGSCQTSFQSMDNQRPPPAAVAHPTLTGLPPMTTPNKSFANVVIVDGVLKKIPRPRNAFMIFANEKRKAFQGMFPNDSNSQVSTRLGDAWRQLPPDVKQGYFDRAKQEDLEHKRRFPNYHYAPNVTRKRKRQESNPPSSIYLPGYKSCSVPQVLSAPRYMGPPRHTFPPQPRPVLESMAPSAGYRCPSVDAGQYPGGISRPPFPQPCPSYSYRPRGRAQRSKKKEMVPGEQSTVSWLLKWGPIQVINTKETTTPAPADARSKPQEYVTETTHAYVPVAEMAPEAMTSQPSQPDMNVAPAPRPETSTAPTLPPVHSLLQPMANEMNPTVPPPYSADNSGNFTVPDHSAPSAMPRPLPVFHHREQAEMAGGGRDATIAQEKIPVPSLENTEGSASSESNTKTSTAEPGSTSSCISRALSTILSGTSPVKAAETPKKKPAAKPTAAIGSNPQARKESTVGADKIEVPQPVPVGNVIQNQHYPGERAYPPEYMGNWGPYPPPSPDREYMQGVCRYQPGPQGWYGGGYHYPSYSYPSQHMDQHYYQYGHDNRAPEMDPNACPPFVFMPCRPTYAASLGWDPKALPHQTDMYNPTMCNVQAACDPGNPCWLPPQEIKAPLPEKSEHPAPVSQTSQAVSHPKNEPVKHGETPTDKSEAVTPRQETKSPIKLVSRDLAKSPIKLVHQKPSQSPVKPSNQEPVLHVIVPTNEKPAPAETENIPEKRAKTCNCEETSKTDKCPTEADLNVAMSLAMLSASGTSMEPSQD